MAGITLNLVIGENGIINRSKQSEEAYTKASIKEEIELTITDIEMGVLSQGGQLTKDKIVEELPNKLSGITAEIAGNEITGEYKDYEFTINENYEVIIGGKLTGNKPEVTLELMTTTISSKVQIKVKASVVDSTITELVAPSGVTLVQEVSQTEKVYEVTKNATYYFTAKAANGRKGGASIKVSNVLEKPILEEVENTGNTITVSVTNAIKANGVTYTYYLNNTAKISNTADSEVILEGVAFNTSNTIYVVVSANGQSLTSDPITVQTGGKLKSPIIDLTADNLVPTPLDYPRVIDVKGFVNCRAGVPNVGQEVTVSITNRETKGDIYYSVDGGETWKKYTGQFKTNYVAEEKIQAKVVVGKNVSKVSKQKNDYVLDLTKDCTASDALEKAAYDGDPNTVADNKGNRVWFVVSKGVEYYQVCFVLNAEEGVIVKDRGSGYIPWNYGQAIDYGVCVPYQGPGRILSSDIVQRYWRCRSRGILPW